MGVIKASAPVVPQYKLRAFAECQALIRPFFASGEIENLYLQEKFMHNLRVGKRFAGNTRAGAHTHTTFIKSNK
jgi:hypothetical protein